LSVSKSGVSVSNWTVKESSRPRRCASGPNIVAPNANAPLPADMSEELIGAGEPNPLGDVQGELREMWRSSPINRYYLPISKMPPMRGDPRREYAGKPPACYPNLSVSRVDRISHRWQSMPQLHRQLPQEDLEEIVSHGQRTREERTGARRSQQSMAATQSWMTSRTKFSSGSSDSCADSVITVPDACFGCSGPSGKQPGRRKKGPLHVACTCCEHRTVKPWHKRRPLGADLPPAPQASSPRDSDDGDTYDY